MSNIRTFTYSFYFTIKLYLCLLFFDIIIATEHESGGMKKKLFPELQNFILESTNKQCFNASKLYFQHLNNLTLWAHEVFDASDTTLPGILSGNTYHLGNWDECVTAPAPFTMQYCLVKIFMKGLTINNQRDQYSIEYSPYDSVLDRLYRKEDSSQLRRDLAYIGICVPGICLVSDLEKALNQHLQKQDTLLSKANISYYSEINAALCQTTNNSEILDNTDIFFCISVGLLAVIVFSGTLLDYMKCEKWKKEFKRNYFGRLILLFSAKQNFKELQKTDYNSPLNVLHGIKVISICMIIMDHRFGTFTSGPVLNFNYIEKEYKSGAAFAIFHGDLFVDSFFVLSGILVAYILLQQYEKKFVNPLLILLMRYIRLVPSYAFVIFFYASLLENTGSGPLWKLIIEPEATDCRKNWWISLLFLSNYINDQNMCMVHSWYLPCDFHYFIVATFTMKILKKRKTLGLSILLFLLIISIIVPFALTIIYERPGTLLFYPDFLVAPKIHPDFRLTYTKSHTRASPYIIGLFAGYAYYKLKENNWKLTKSYSHLLVIMSTILLVGAIGSGIIFHKPANSFNAIESGIYAGFHRIMWALGTVGLLFTASHGYSNLLKSLLSCRPMIFLGKLVYGVYIIHMQFALRAVAASKSPAYLSIIYMAPMVFGDIVIAFASSLLLFLAIEMPFRNLLKDVFFPRTPISKFGVSYQETRKTSQKIIHNYVESRL